MFARVINRNTEVPFLTHSVEDEYKVVCALSNSAAFDDLQ